MEEHASLKGRVALLESQTQPLLALSSQLSSVATQLGDLKAELAGLKGRATGIAATVMFVAPILASCFTALAVKLLKIG